jgi:flagellar FliL protein
MSAPPASEPPPKKGKPVVLIVVLANVLLGGGAAAFFFLRGSASAAPPAGEHGEAPHGEAAPAEHSTTVKATGPIVEFRPLIVNLNEPEGARYLKATIAVQLVNDKATADVERLKPVITDHFIRDLSELNFRQTMGGKAKVAIKRRLLKRFNEAMGADVGAEAHLVEFIVQ